MVGPSSRRRIAVNRCEKCGRKRRDVIPVVIGASDRFHYCGLCRQLGFSWSESVDRRTDRLPSPPTPIAIATGHAHVLMHSVVERREQLALGTIAHSAHVIDEGAELRPPRVCASLQVVGLDGARATTAKPSERLPTSAIGEDQRE